MPDLDRIERDDLEPASVAGSGLGFAAASLRRGHAGAATGTVAGAGAAGLRALLRFLVLGQRPTAPRDAGWLLGLFYDLCHRRRVVRNHPAARRRLQGPDAARFLLRALATLAFGLLFYAVARLHLRSVNDIRNATFWLMAGLSASIALAALQVIAIVAGGTWLHRMQAITNLFAVWHGGLEKRAQGMTLEPSWLATQIILLMLPALVARIISRQRSAGEPVGRRNILIALGGFAVALIGLLCAGSRFGLASAILMLLLAGLMALWEGRMAAAISLIALLMAGGGGMLALNRLSAGAGTSYVLGPLAYLTDGAQSAALNDPDVATTVTDALSVAGRAAGQAALGGVAGSSLVRNFPGQHLPLFRPLRARLGLRHGTLHAGQDGRLRLAGSQLAGKSQCQEFPAAPVGRDRSGRLSSVRAVLHPGDFRIAAA